MKTATQAAKELGVSVATISRRIKTLGIGRKHGYTFWLTVADVAKLRASIKKGATNGKRN